MNNRNFPWAIIAAAAVAGAGFAGIATYVRQNQADPVLVKNSIDNPNGGTGGTVEKDSLSGDTNSVNGEGPSKGSGKPENHQVNRISKVDTLNKAIKNANYSQKGIRVLDVTVENGNAIIDMNAAVQDSWGSEAEAKFIDTMRDALTPFNSIKTFQIRVDGQILKTLSHFEVDPVTVR
jgi:Sporulation and spore germination